MNERKMVKVTRQDNTVVDAEVVLTFKLPDTGKDYMIYSYDGEDDGDMKILNVAIVSETPEGFLLDKIEDNEEWKKVKDFMRQVVRNNGE